MASSTTDTQIVSYNNLGEMLFDGVPVKSVCAEGPRYVYSRSAVQKRVDFFLNQLSLVLPRFSVHYAMKANHHPEILKIMKSKGIGVDVVSGGELTRATEAGFEGRDIVFSGVGKTEREISLALQSEVGSLNVESLSELKRIARLAQAAKKVARVSLRLNPDVNAETHPYIATGFRENKFGLDAELLQEAVGFLRTQSSLKMVGLSIHIGSQLLRFGALSEALSKARQTYDDLKAQGFPLEFLDIGGGVGVVYESSAENDLPVILSYMSILKESLRDFSDTVVLEPGRILVARCGMLLTQIQYIKPTAHKTFVIVDTGMNHLLRPALYQAFHRILPVLRRPGRILIADVVGPVCESSDVLGQNRDFSAIEEGDWLAILDVGAYGAVMASGYNSFPMPPSIFL